MSPDQVQVQEAQTRTPKAPPLAPATAPSKTRELVGQVQGFAAQSALLAPGQAPPPPASSSRLAPAAAEATKKAEAPHAATGASEAKAQAPAQGGDTDLAAAGLPATAAEDASAEKLSPIREALLKQFELLEGKGVGDKEFDAVCSKASWERMKGEEDAKRAKAEADYKVAMAEYEASCARDPGFKKTARKPVKAYVPVYTTCIDTMNAVTRAAWKASGLAVKRVDGKKFDQFAFGSLSRVEGTKIGAWVEASPKMGKSPKTGDMMMLEKAGATVDKLGAEQRGQELNFGSKQKKLEKELANLEAASASASSALAQASAARAPIVAAALEKVRADYEAAKQTIKGKLAEAEAGLAKRVGEGAKLEFSHVGFFKSKDDEVGADGKKTGREVWTTFDGGQSGIAGKVSGQGAKAGKRYYDPATNMVTGEASQGGAMRWLAGWIDVDKMVKQGAENKAQ